ASNSKRKLEERKPSRQGSLFVDFGNRLGAANVEAGVLVVATAVEAIADSDVNLGRGFLLGFGQQLLELFLGIESFGSGPSRQNRRIALSIGDKVLQDGQQQCRHQEHFQIWSDQKLAFHT